MAVTGGRWPMHTSLPLSFYMSRGFEFLQVGREGGEVHHNDDGMIGSERHSLQGTSTYIGTRETEKGVARLHIPVGLARCMSLLAPDGVAVEA